jgi:small GTP-binding protein
VTLVVSSLHPIFSNLQNPIRHSLKQSGDIPIGLGRSGHINHPQGLGELLHLLFWDEQFMPHVEIPQLDFKLVVLGSSHIGKSSLVTRFSEGYYRENSRQPTVGAAFVTKRIQSSENVTCKVQIWDTAGQANFRAMAHMFYGDAAAVVVCYDVGSRRSYDEMRGWLDELRVKTGDEVVVAIAALKADLMHHCNDIRGRGLLLRWSSWWVFW